ncbi:protein trichome birefringence-like 5 [Vitis riparia]|uniref:protein trichome birefringence-like 5 n=1 Tax=Vitis riparia TaxID=96939 RepID=UPI00155AA085|nr:protein trichome birefringence-like 5 [Vitis riparia]
MVDNGGVVSMLENCDLYMGTWMKDEEYPIYSLSSCPYVDEAFSCQGLPDKSRMYEIHGHQITKGKGYFVFNFTDHNCTVEFVRSHFLVREGTRINEQEPTTSLSDLVTVQAPNLTT